MLIMPIINYAEVVYSDLESLSSHKLQVAFNDSVRYIYQVRRYDRISLMARNTLGCTLEQHRIIKNCLFLFKLISRRTPYYLYSKLQFTRSVRTFNIVTLRYNYLNSSQLFFINAVKIWNSLPQNIKRVSNSI